MNTIPALKEAADIVDLFKLGKKEDLHPDLKAHVVTRGHPHISHPLIIEVFYAPELNAWINKRYAVKKQLFEESIAKREWRVISTLIEKPFRVEYLLRFSDVIPHDEWWRLAGDIWTSVENLWQYRGLIPLLFRGKRGTIPELLEACNSADVFRGLPDTLTIYRGCQWRNRRGWSWTLSKKTARFFAVRYATPGSKVRIVTGQARKHNVLFYTDQRNEQEIVINPEDVTTLSTSVFYA